MISLVSLISKGMWNNKDEIADTFFVEAFFKEIMAGMPHFPWKNPSWEEISAWVVSWYPDNSPNELMNFSPPEIPWKPFLTCQDDDEMVTHVASARSDAKSKKKKKAIDIFFVSNGGGLFLSSSGCLRVQSLALGVGDSSWGCLVFLVAPKIAIFIQKSYQSDEWRWCWIDLDSIIGDKSYLSNVG